MLNIYISCAYLNSINLYCRHESQHVLQDPAPYSLLSGLISRFIPGLIICFCFYHSDKLLCWKLSFGKIKALFFSPLLFFLISVPTTIPPRESPAVELLNRYRGDDSCCKYSQTYTYLPRLQTTSRISHRALLLRYKQPKVAWLLGSRRRSTVQD